MAVSPRYSPFSLSISRFGRFGRYTFLGSWAKSDDIRSIPNFLSMALLRIGWPSWFGSTDLKSKHTGFVHREMYRPHEEDISSTKRGSRKRHDNLDNASRLGIQMRSALALALVPCAMIHVPCLCRVLASTLNCEQL